MKPAINTNLDVISHAHPLPVRSSPHEQRVRAAVAHIPIAVNLHGLSFRRAMTVTDVLTPKVRRTPFNENVNPNHLDVTECWKGLSHTQARELTMWYQFLHECLHNEVREALSKDIVKDLLESKAADEVYLVACMLECLRRKPRRIIDVSSVGVIDSMMTMFHTQFPSESASLASSWSHFSGGLSCFLHNFIRLQDCFLQSAHGPCLEITFDFQYANWLLTATGDVVWQSPNIRFLHVPTTRASGEIYRITPFVWKEVDSLVNSPRCDDYVDQVDYTIRRSSFKNLTWDPEKRCFKTVVGFFRDGKPHTVETVVMATVMTPFPDYVKFERLSRWSIKLEVMPECQPPIPHDVNRRAYEALEAEYGRFFETAAESSEHETVVRYKAESHISSASPQKRKVSRPEFVDAAPVTKRRRHKSVSDVDDEPPSDIGSLSDGCLKSRYMKEVHQVAEKKANDSGTSHAHPRSPSATYYDDIDSHITSRHQSFGPSTEDLVRCVRESSSCSTSPDISEDSVPWNDDEFVATDHKALRQEEILDNYHEFADRNLFKDAGLISPISDGERRVYENIFVEDGDEWSPITDESAMTLDSVLGEKQG